MAEQIIATAITNITPNSCVNVTCDCNTMWSFTQEFSYLRLSNISADFKAKLIDDYAVRARRIAATYARFYLEAEDVSDPAKKGRFYWMALGAFASKTVACTLEDLRVSGMGLLPNMPKGAPAAISPSEVYEGLGKGNFWLFQDISGWHYYYAKYPTSFDTCLDSRNANAYAKPVQAAVNKLPWKAEALPKIKNLAVSKEIKTGFALVKQIEETTRANDKPPLQLKHLLAIADHEQGVILQPLIYEEPKFAWWIQAQRSPWIKWASPNLELVFSSACSIKDEKLKSVAPADTKLEDFDSRMKWIGKAAEKFHNLMQIQQIHMEGELQKMAGWVSLQPKPLTRVAVPRKY
jgi:hypothetical protein